MNLFLKIQAYLGREPILDKELILQNDGDKDYIFFLVRHFRKNLNLQMHN